MFDNKITVPKKQTKLGGRQHTSHEAEALSMRHATLILWLFVFVFEEN